uniref:Succinate dehydrogenase assembly factor 3 n=1 Tax=Cyprinus carpio TaxID=7962 RepID=A0A8C1JUM2_CYPCA
MAPAAHVSAVRSLYKRILLLHRFMPIDLRALGDQYVKDEFRRHKTASAEEVTRFMAEWQVVSSHCENEMDMKWKPLHCKRNCLYKRCYQISSSLMSQENSLLKPSTRWQHLPKFCSSMKNVMQFIHNP